MSRLPPIDAIPQGLLDQPVVGSGLHSGSDGRTTFGSQLDGSRPTLLLFLRHLGCVFCREMVKDVRIASDRADAWQTEKRYPRVVFVHTASVEAGARFFGRYWPGAPAVADQARRLYAAMGLTRGTVGQLFGPRALVCGLRAVSKGHGLGRPAGDPWMMPGAFLVSPEGRVLRQHVFIHAGDHPAFDTFCEPRPELVPSGDTSPAPTPTVAGA